MCGPDAAERESAERVAARVEALERRDLGRVVERLGERRPRARAESRCRLPSSRRGTSFQSWLWSNVQLVEVDLAAEEGPAELAAERACDVVQVGSVMSSTVTKARRASRLRTSLFPANR